MLVYHQKTTTKQYNNHPIAVRLLETSSKFWYE